MEPGGAVGAERSLTIPRLAAWLIGRCVPADRRAEVLDDLAEGVASRRRHGRPTRWWIWRQTGAFVVGVPGAVIADRWRRRRAPIPRAGAPTFHASRPTMEHLMDTWLQDFRYAVRGLLGAKAFTAVAVLTLGLGIGVNTAMFTVINAFLFRPLPVPNPEQLVVVASQTDLVEFPIGVSYPNYLDYRERTDVVQDMVTYLPMQASLRDRGEAQRAWVELVSGNYFDVLGVDALYGRMFNAGETEVRGAASLMVISHDYWQREYGGDPSVVGRAVELNGSPFTIVGIARAEFPGTEFLIGVDAYVPTTMLEQIRPDYTGVLDARGSKVFRCLARLQPGVTIEQARASLNVLANQLEQEYPQANRATDLVLVPETQARPEVATANWLPDLAMIFMGLVSLVLLIACANIANLLLARASTRNKEIAIRSALGAGRMRIVRQLISESTVLGVLGGVVGVALGLWASGYLAAGATDFAGDIPLRLDMSPDYRVFGFAFGLALATGVLAGGLPALRATRSDLLGSLKEGGRTASGRGSGQFLRGALVVGQVAVSVVLLVAAGLFMRSLQNARNLDFGFRVDDTLLVSIDPTIAGYDEERGRRVYREVIDAVRAVPGVAEASFSAFVPFGGQAGLRNVTLDGRPATEGSDTLAAFYSIVGTDYFRAAGTTVLRGRGFTEGDVADAPRVALVNDSMARILWQEDDPIGKRFSITGTGGPWHEVVGLTVDSKVLLVWEESRPMFYLSDEQYYPTPATLYIHTDVEAASLGPAVRAAIAAVDPDLPAYNVTSMRAHLENGPALGIVSVAALMVGSFGVVGLALAAIGLYGVISFFVSQRFHEIGVRLALGADTGSVLTMVVGRGMLLTGLGMVGGLGLAVLASQVLSTITIGVSATDGLVYGAVVVFLTSVALMASYLPARRATRVDPLVALREE